MMANKIYKTFQARAKAVNEKDGIYEVMISTETVDRQGDIVRATGALVGNYLKNPVVLWAHLYDQPPVAKALSVEILPGRGMKSRFQFPRPGISSLADTVRGLWSDGFINAASIGFIPLDSKPVNPNDKWGGQEYTSWELLEYSLVPVPAQADAVRLAMKHFKRGDRQHVTDYRVKGLELSLQLLELARARNSEELLIASFTLYGVFLQALYPLTLAFEHARQEQLKGQQAYQRILDRLDSYNESGIFIHP